LAQKITAGEALQQDGGGGEEMRSNETNNARGKQQGDSDAGVTVSVDEAHNNLIVDEALILSDTLHSKLYC
jgi:hypothetical protein